ncbi:Holliday junction DNA helicase B [Haemophilus influenzae 22.4-21]|uniref:Holliday junction DNA helicase B n=1 Tax=Haemophilus influenzae 22.4-21 TaxID=375063 RepID=A4NW27_HAEIF|nr:Holliday junction DNA helicase B [Haemophilus influenzae 22.4-21]
MIEADRIISGQAKVDEDVIDRAIRPKLLADYVGQPQVREQMDIFIKAAKLRQDALDHLLILALQVWEKQRLLILWQMKWA